MAERRHDLAQSTLAVIMGGGAGKRLYPLTKERAKPAVPFGGKYRLVDIPISNCLNSGIKYIYLLTQFNSASLHKHIASTYRFDRFSSGFVEILAAQQTPSSEHWYQGTADAVRKNKVLLCYAENWVYAPPIAKLRRLIQAAAGGRILDLRAQESHSGSSSMFSTHWKNAGGGSLTPT